MAALNAKIFVSKYPDLIILSSDDEDVSDAAKPKRPKLPSTPTAEPKGSQTQRLPVIECLQFPTVQPAAEPRFPQVPTGLATERKFSQVPAEPAIEPKGPQIYFHTNGHATKEERRRCDFISAANGKILVNDFKSLPETVPASTSNGHIEAIPNIIISDVHSLNRDQEKLHNLETSQPSTSGEASAKNNDTLSMFLTNVDKYISKSDKKVLEIIKRRATRCPDWYLRSEEFKETLNRLYNKIEKDQCHIFLHIKEVSDELSAYSRPKKGHKNSEKSESECSDKKKDTGRAKDVEEQKLEARIIKLEKILEKLNKRIKKAQAEELSFEDMEDENSHYIYEDKLKKKFMGCYNLLCKLKGRNTSTGRLVTMKFEFNGSRYPELNNKIQKFINKTSGISFPDYSDIYKLVQHCNEEYNFCLTETSASMLAREVFEDIGIELQRRRKEDSYELLGCYLTDDIGSPEDPALKDPDLENKLQTNCKEGQSKLDEIISKFVSKEVELKNKNQEDNSGDQSEDESDKEGENDESDKEDDGGNNYDGGKKSDGNSSDLEAEVIEILSQGPKEKDGAVTSTTSPESSHDEASCDGSLKTSKAIAESLAKSTPETESAQSVGVKRSSDSELHDERNFKRTATIDSDDVITLD